MKLPTGVDKGNYRALKARRIAVMVLQLPLVMVMGAAAALIGWAGDLRLERQRGD